MLNFLIREQDVAPTNIMKASLALAFLLSGHGRLHRREQLGRATNSSPQKGKASSTLALSFQTTLLSIYMCPGVS